MFRRQSVPFFLRPCSSTVPAIRTSNVRRRRKTISGKFKGAFEISIRVGIEMTTEFSKKSAKDCVCAVKWYSPPPPPPLLSHLLIPPGSPPPFPRIVMCFLCLLNFCWSGNEHRRGGEVCANSPGNGNFTTPKIGSKICPPPSTLRFPPALLLFLWTKRGWSRRRRRRHVLEKRPKSTSEIAPFAVNFCSRGQVCTVETAPASFFIRLFVMNHIKIGGKICWSS